MIYLNKELLLYRLWPPNGIRTTIKEHNGPKQIYINMTKLLTILCCKRQIIFLYFDYLDKLLVCLTSVLFFKSCTWAH